jgi:hypothetical protein
MEKNIARRAAAIIAPTATCAAHPSSRWQDWPTLNIDTVSHDGPTAKDKPVTFFVAAGIPPERVLQ